LYDKDRETEWLNEMAVMGYAMTGFCAGFYRFDRCLPGEYAYQVDITEGFCRVSDDYREFMHEAGVEIVCLWGPWVILRKKAAEGPFELYTDVESKIQHYTKIRTMFKLVAILESCCLVIELFAAMAGVPFGLAACCVLAAILLVVIRELTRLNGILSDLKVQIGVEGAAERSGRKQSLLIPAGSLLNAIGFGVPIWMADSGNGFLLGFLKSFFHGLGFILIVVGVVITFWRRED